MPDDLLEWAKSLSVPQPKPSDSRSESLRRAADSLGVDAGDLGSIISFETGGTFDPHKVGGEGNKYKGLIQFGPDEQRKYYKPNDTFESQVENGVVNYFRDRFKQAGKDTRGASLEDLYTTVIAGNPNANRNAKDSFGTSARSGTQRIANEHRPKVLANFFGGSDTRIDPDEVWASIDATMMPRSSEKPPMSPTDVGKAPAPTMPAQMPSNLGSTAQATPPMPESPDTLEYQRRAAHDPQSTRAAVLYTPGAPVPPTMKGETDIRLKDGSVLRANIEKFNQWIKDNGPTAYNDLKNGDLDFTSLIGGKAQPTSDTAGKAAVVTRDPEGRELVASSVENLNDDVVAMEAAMQKAQFPNQPTETKVETAEEVVGRRMGHLTPMDELSRIGEASRDGKQYIDESQRKWREDALPGEQPTETILRTKREPTEKRYREFLTQKGLPNTEESQKAFNEQSKADWLAQNPKLKQYAEEEGRDPFDEQTIAKFNEIQKIEAERGQARRQKAAAVQSQLSAAKPSYDFVEKGELTLPGGMDAEGKQLVQPTKYKYDKANQESLQKGEYRVTDEDGTAYIFTPSTGKFIDEADTQVLKTVDLDVPEKGSITALVAKRNAAHQIAEAISDEYKLPKQDVVDFFDQQGLSDWETGEDFTEENYFRVTSDAPKTQPFHLTQRTVNQIEAFSKAREESKAKYEAAKQTYTDAGDDEFTAEVKARKDAKWMRGAEADEELDLYQAKKDEFNTYFDMPDAEGTPRSKEAVKELTDNAVNEIRQKYGSFKEFEAENKRIAALPVSERVTEMARSFVAVAPKIIGGLLKTGGAVAVGLNKLGLLGTPKSDAKIEDTFFYQSGAGWDIISDWGKNKVAHEAWESKVADTIAQVGIQAGSAYLTRGMSLPAAIGLSQGAGQAIDAAIKDGATTNQQLGMAAVGAVAAMPDVLLMKGWFRSFTGQARIGLVKKLGQSVYKQMVLKGATSAEASTVGRLAMTGFVQRAGQLGQKILFNAEKEVFKPLTVGSAIGKLAKGAAFEGYQEGGPILGENDLNELGKKFIYKPELTFADIAKITDEDVESMQYGAVGGAFGGLIEIATHPDAFKTYKDRKTAYAAIDEALADHALQKTGDKSFSLGGKDFEITDDIADAIQKYQDNEAAIKKNSKGLAGLPAKAKKAKTFGERRALVTESRELQKEIIALSEERGTLASQLISNADAGEALISAVTDAETTPSAIGKTFIDPATGSEYVITGIDDTGALIDHAYTIEDTKTGKKGRAFQWEADALLEAPPNSPEIQGIPPEVSPKVENIDTKAAPVDAVDTKKKVTDLAGRDWTVIEDRGDRGVMVQKEDGTKTLLPLDELTAESQAELKSPAAELPQHAEFPDSLGIARADMPQVAGKDQAEFQEFAKGRGVTIAEETISVKDLKPTQREYNPQQAAQIPLDKVGAKPLMVSSDNRILDGHNTLVKLREVNPDSEISILRIPLKAKEALALMKEFPKTTFKDVTQTGATPDAEGDVETMLKSTVGDLLNSINARKSTEPDADERAILINGVDLFDEFIHDPEVPGIIKLVATEARRGFRRPDYDYSTQYEKIRQFKLGIYKEDVATAKDPERLAFAKEQLEALQNYPVQISDIQTGKGGEALSSAKLVKAINRLGLPPASEQPGLKSVPRQIEFEGTTLPIEPLKLAPELAKVQEQVLTQVAADPGKFVQRYYDEVPNGLKVFNADEAKGLFPEYDDDRLIRVASVHEASSLVAKLAMQKRMRDLPDGSAALAMAGGAAAGKTTAAQDEIKTADLVFDGVMKNPANNEQILIEMRANGLNPRIVFVFRDPSEAGMLNVRRSATEKRVVPAKVGGNGHFASAKAFLDHTYQWAKAHGLGVAIFRTQYDQLPQEITIDDLKRLVYNRTEADVVRQFLDAGLKEYEQNKDKYDERVPAALRGESVPARQNDRGRKDEADLQGSGREPRQAEPGDLQGDSRQRPGLVEGETSLKKAPVREANSAIAIVEGPAHPRRDKATGVIAALKAQFKRISSKSVEEMSDTEVVDAIAAHTEAELGWWLKNSEGYKGFYTDDIKASNKQLQKWAQAEHGRKLTDEEVSLYHLVSAFGSPSANPVQDSSLGLLVLDKYLRTGKLTGLSQKQATQWLRLDDKGIAKFLAENPGDGQQFLDEYIAQYPSRMGGKRADTSRLKFATAEEMLPVRAQISRAYQAESLAAFNDLSRTFPGERSEQVAAAIRWLQTEHPYAEIAEKFDRPLTGEKSIKPSEYLTRDGGGYGVFGLTGTKLGSYFLNRTTTLETATKDLWYARTMARYLGMPLTEGKTSEPLKSPWSDEKASDVHMRKLADDAWRRVGEKHGMELAEVQQALWDFEKRLWERLGHPAEDRVFVSDGLAVGEEMVQAVKITPPLMSATVGVAPLRAGTIKKLRGAAQTFAGTTYQEFTKLHGKVVAAFKQPAKSRFPGLTVNEIKRAIGAFGKTSSNFEASLLPTVTGPADDVRLYATLMAVLAPDIQYSALVSAYDFKGEDAEYRITFPTREAAEDFVARRDEFGLVANRGEDGNVIDWNGDVDLSYLPGSKTVILLDINRFGKLNFAKFNEAYAQSNLTLEKRRASIEFIESADYGRNVQAARLDPRRQDGGVSGAKLNSLLDQAEAKLRKQGLWPEDGLKSVSRPIQTDTPSFKKWFKDSKVVDENGEPLVVYHATAGDLEVLLPGGNDPGRSGRAIWLGVQGFDPHAAHNVGGPRRGFKDGANVMPLYASIQNPLIITGKTRDAVAQKYGPDVPWLISDKAAQLIQADGHDGILYYNETQINPRTLGEYLVEPPQGAHPARLEELVVFSSTQIKSAIGNNGNFDENDPSILKSAAKPFYSQLERTIEQKMPAKASADQVRGIIKDTKQEERDWTGIDEFLDTKGSFTKEEVLAFVRENNVDVREVMAGGYRWDGDDLMSGGERVANVVGNEDGTWSYMSDSSDGSDSYDTRYDATVEAELATVHDPYFEGPGSTEFDQYTLPGGENYRELLITMPENDYTSSHWSEKGVIAHVRFDDRYIPRPASTVEAKAQETGADSLAAHAKALTDLIEAPADLSKVLDGSNVQRDKAVVAGVVGTVRDREIRRRVVELIPVDMMDKLVAAELTPEQFFGNDTMLTDSLTGNPDAAVRLPLGTRRAFVGSVARLVAKETSGSTNPVGLPIQSGVAPGTSDIKDSHKPYRTLHIAEIQSDLHQAGRKKGYKGNPDTAGWTATKAEGDPASGPIWAVRDAKGRWILGVPRANIDTAEGAIRRAADSDRGPDGSRVPDAPFKKTWHELAFKKALRYAVENDFDAISWDTGATNAERYSISNHVKSIEVDRSRSPYTDEERGSSILVTLTVTTRQPIDFRVNPDTGIIVESDKSEFFRKPLDEVIGKEMAERILAGEGEKVSKNIRRFSGDGLKVGGAGMVGFYDKMLPAFVNKYTKKWGGKVEAGSVGGKSGFSADWQEPYITGSLADGYAVRAFRPNSDLAELLGVFDTQAEAERELREVMDDRTDVHVLLITPAMRESVMEGQPLFRLIGKEDSRRSEGSMQLRRELESEEDIGVVFDGISGGLLHGTTGEWQINEHDAEVLRRLLALRTQARTGKAVEEGAFDGIVWSPLLMKNLVAFGRSLVAGVKPHVSEKQLRQYNRLLDMLDTVATESKGHQVVYVYEDALPHERTHKEDLDAGRTSAKALETLKANPLWAGSPAFNEAYGHVSETDRASELAAILASGEAKYYGLDKVPNFEANKDAFLDTWSDGIIETNATLIDQMGFETWAAQYPIITGLYSEALTRQGQSNANNKTDQQGAAAKDQKTEGPGTAPGGSSQALPQKPPGFTLVDPEEAAGQQLGPKTKLASLPETLRSYGIAAVDTAYTVYGDTEATADAVEIFENSGLKGSMQLLSAIKDPDASHTILAGIVYDTLLNRSFDLQGAEAQEARLAADKFLHEFTVRTIKAGRFIRAIQLMQHSPAVTVLKGAETLAEEADNGLSDDQIQNLGNYARDLEAAFAETQFYKKEAELLRKEMADLDARLTEALTTKQRARATAGRRRVYKQIETQFGGEIAAAMAKAERMADESNGLLSPAHHGTPHVFKAEILIEKDGKREFIVGDIDQLPEVPKGATVVKKFPLGRMRLNAIGSGEGHAAYGHGLYFASQEKVADWYRQQLSKGGTFSYDGKEWSPGIVAWTDYSGKDRALDVVRSAAQRNNGPFTQEQWEDIEGGLSKEVAHASMGMRGNAIDKYPALAARRDVAQKTLDAFRELDRTKVAYKPSGARYKVDLAPAEDEYLDLDKGYNDQSQKVKDALGKPEEFIKKMGGTISVYDTSTGPVSGGDVMDWKGIPEAEQNEVWRNLSGFQRDAGIKEFRMAHANAKEAEVVLNNMHYRGKGQSREEAIENALVQVNGRIIYNLITRLAIRSLNYGKPSQEFASNWLLEKGIRGNRYLDGDSRHKGKQDHNFVIFDDRDVAIESVLKSVAYQGSPRPFNKEVLVRDANGNEVYLQGTPDKMPKVPKTSTVIKEFPHGRHRTEKIGTGEGNAAYGYGHYFAEREAVSHFYKNTLAVAQNQISYKGQPVRDIGLMEFDLTPEEYAWKRLQNEIRNAPLATDNWVRNAKFMALHVNGGGEPSGHQKAAAAILDKIDPDQITFTKGARYKVDLRPKDDEYLLWDKPIAEQSDKVRPVVEELIKRYDTVPKRLKKWVDDDGDENDVDPITDGGTFYRALKALQDYPYYPGKDKINKIFPELSGYAPYGSGLSKLLLSKGVRGNKYLDGDSRSGGEGSFNYVIFDENDVEIESVLKSRRPADEFDSTAYKKQRDAIELVTDKAGNLLAPNGKKSNLNEYLWRTVRTPEFKAWSKGKAFLDENGEPQVYYHGTREDFEAINPERGGRRGADMPLGAGFYLTSVPEVASGYARGVADDELRPGASRKGPGGRMMMAFARGENLITGKEYNDLVNEVIANRPSEKERVANGFTPFLQAEDVSEQIQEELGRRGVDAIVDPLPMPGGPVYETVAVRQPANVKSVFNQGSFSSTDPVMLKSVSRPPQTETPAFKKWFKNSAVVDEGGNPKVVVHATGGDFDTFARQRPGQKHEGFALHFGTPEQAQTIAGQRGGVRKLRRPGANTVPVYLSLQKPLPVPDWGDGKDPVMVMSQIFYAAIYSRNPLLASSDKVQSWWKRQAPTAFTPEQADKLRAGLLGNRGGWGSTKSQIETRNHAMTVIRDWVQGFGYDGLVYLNLYEGVKKGEGQEDSYAVFKPTQIKSAIGNRGTFDPNEPSILKSAAQDPDGQQRREFVDLLGTIGAGHLAKGLAEDVPYMPETLKAVFEAQFGSDVMGPIFDDVYARAVEIRDGWLQSIAMENNRAKASRRREDADFEKNLEKTLGRKLPEKLTDKDVLDILGVSRDVTRRQRAIEKMHRYASGVRKAAVPLELRQMILGLAETELEAVAAQMVAENVPPAKIYDVLEDLANSETKAATLFPDGYSLKAAKEAFARGKEIVDQAKQEVKDHRAEVAQETAAKSELVKDAELAEIKAREKLQATKSRIADEYDKIRNPKTHYAKKAYTTTVDLLRNLTLSAEMSFLRRQGGKYIRSEVATWPARRLRREAPETTRPPGREAIRTALPGGDQAYAVNIKAIENHYLYPEAAKMGVDFSTAGKLGTGQHVGEEQLQSEAIDRMVEFLNKSVLTRNTIALWPKMIQRFDKSMAIFLDNLRIRLYARLSNTLRDKGFDPKKDRGEFEELARRINTGTARPNKLTNKTIQGGIDFAVNTKVFLAPSYTVAKWQDLGADTRNVATAAAKAVAFQGLPKGTQKIMIERAVASYAALVAEYAMWAYLIGALVSFDPDDDDFLRLKVGHYRYDLTQGNRAELRYIGRMVKHYDDPRKVLDLNLRYVRTRLNMLPGFAVNAYTEKDVAGKDFDLKDPLRWMGLVTPMVYMNAIGAAKEAGPFGVGATMPFDWIGIPASVYPDRVKDINISIEAAKKNGDKAEVERLEKEKVIQQQKEAEQKRKDTKKRLDDKPFNETSEGKKASTDDMVSYIEIGREQGRDTSDMEKILHKKVENAQKARTFTPEEAQRVNALLGTRYLPRERKTAPK